MVPLMASNNPIDVSAFLQAAHNCNRFSSIMCCLKTTVNGKKVGLFDPHETVRARHWRGPLASFRQRSAAFAIDFLVVLAIYIPAAILRQYLEMRPCITRCTSRVLQFSRVGGSGLDGRVRGLLVWMTNGLTVGKRLLRIRVVSLKRPKISLWQALERALGYGASALEGGFGFIQFFIHHNRQCVHDRIAETIVVKEQPKERLP